MEAMMCGNFYIQQDYIINTHTNTYTVYIYIYIYIYIYYIYIYKINTHTYFITLFQHAYWNVMEPNR